LIPRPDVFDFFYQGARNGAAIVYTEAIVADHKNVQGYPGQARLVEQQQIEAWKPLVRSIQKEGAIAMWKEALW